MNRHHLFSRIGKAVLAAIPAVCAQWRIGRLSRAGEQHGSGHTARVAHPYAGADATGRTAGHGLAGLYQIGVDYVSPAVVNIRVSEKYPRSKAWICAGIPFA